MNAARGYVAEGRRWTVDLDLEKFFDRVNHDVLMARVGRKVKDPGVLKLIRRYLEAGLMEGGVANARSEGRAGQSSFPVVIEYPAGRSGSRTERRGHRFCRYADDCNIYVQSDRAGQRVRQSITAFLGHEPPDAERHVRVVGAKGRRRAVLFPRCYRISCWTIWIANWNDGVIVSADTPTTATSMSKAIGQDRGSGNRSRRFWSKG